MEDNKVTIFLSHSTKDKTLAKSVYKLITHFIHLSDVLRGKYEVFYSPKSLSEFKYGSDNWKEGISKAMSNSKCCLVLLTPNSIENRWVNYELGLATAHNIRIIPIGTSGVDFQLVIRNEIQMIDLSRYANVMTMIDHIFNEHFKLNIDISTLEDSSKGQQMIADVISAALIKNIYIVGNLNDKSKSEQVENFVSTLSNKLLENDFHLSSYPSVNHIGEIVAQCALKKGESYYEIAGLYKFDNRTNNVLKKLNINNDVWNKMLKSFRKIYLDGKDCMVIIGGGENTRNEYNVAKDIDSLQIFPIPCFGGFARELFNELNMNMDYNDFAHPCSHCLIKDFSGHCPHIEKFVARFKEYKKLIH